MFRFGLRLGATLVAAGVLALAACAGTAARWSGARDLGAASDAPLRLFVTGDTRGYLDTCGCEGAQSGGVARRATYKHGTRRPGDVWIDLGNLTTGTAGLRDLRRAAQADALALLRYDVVVPGRAEVVDGAAFDEVARKHGLAVVSANVVDASGTLVHSPRVVLPLPDGRRVGIVGITEPVPDAPSGRRVLPAGDALRDQLAALAGEADVVVVATSLPVADARRLAERARQVAVVLSGSTPEPDAEFDRSAGPLVAVAGHMGQYVARIDFGADLRPGAAWRAWMDERVADDPALAARVKQFQDDAAALDGDLPQRLVAARRTESYAGSKSCEPCHEEDYAIWKASLHGRAMRILVEKEVSRDPDCVPCHLVDVPPDGAPFDPDAMGVGCEACHGGSAAHNADPRVRTPAADGGKASCAAKCHHPPEVKNFDFEVQWPRIRHGKTNPPR